MKLQQEHPTMPGTAPDKITWAYLHQLVSRDPLFSLLARLPCLWKRFDVRYLPAGQNYAPVPKSCSCLSLDYWPHAFSTTSYLASEFVSNVRDPAPTIRSMTTAASRQAQRATRTSQVATATCNSLQIIPRVLGSVSPSLQL